MTTEKINGQSQVAAIPQLRQAWRDLAVQQWLLQANARLEIQSVLASRAYDYLGQLQKNIEQHQAAVQERLTAYGKPSGSTQQSDEAQSTALALIKDLAAEGPVNTETLNEALKKGGHYELPKNVAQGLINQFYLTS
jgi:hypothetical protein